MRKTIKVITYFIAVLICHSSFAQLQEVLMLTVSSGIYRDETVVRFLDDATDSFDSPYDAYKFDNPGMTPTLFTASDESYAINALHSEFEEKTLLLYFRSKFSGSYTLSAEEIGAFDSTWSITLVDKKLHTESNLRTAPNYVFLSQQGEADNRFLLQFKIKKTGIVTSSIDDRTVTDVMIYSYEESILIQMESESGTVFITDILGHEILNAAIYSARGSAWSFSPGKQGTYIVNLVRNNKRYYKKVYVSSSVIL